MALLESAIGRVSHIGKLLAGLFAGFLLAACAEDFSSPEPKLTVTVYEVGPAVVNRKAKFLGRVVSADLTRVAFRIPGKIELLAVQSGQQVVAGQVIARIENTIQRQMLADAQAQSELSERQLQRANNLLDIGAITQAQIDELRAGFALATANLKLAEAGLTYTVIKAPFNGTVIDVDKELFESVMPGETVVTVSRSDRIDVLINIPDGLPARLQQTVDTLSYSPRVMFAGHAEVYPMKHLKNSSARNPQVEAFQLWLTMPAADLRIPPGVPATVTVDLEEAGLPTDSGVVVPVTALQPGTDPEAFQVWRYQQGTVNPVTVNVGRIATDGAFIASGLQAGDLIITSSLYRLQPGQAVNISPRNQGH